MKILIVEDETAAYENLADMILSLDSSIEIMGNTESVRQTVRWLQANPKPDLLFMDITQLSLSPKYKDKLLIPVKDKLLPIGLNEVSCFYTADKNTYIYLRNGGSYPYAKTLEQIISSLNPAEFIRANKQFIISRDSVKDITIWFDSRLLVTLDIEVPERIYISKNKASEFKSWIVSQE
ncbi:response regulator transcription factor [Parabacteroides distasonis]|uniref:LytR/AlgR family response regulator transcription factor n=1 Tax=Parabacteroides distasonis TaxID=823 RepID=UPI00232F2282|nr:response regulator transcription factor [Parabacteroides distasonis]MDB9172887.1 response regulator transcription factor [Parabacteroides distasonis]MDB9185681.1 response regulator transcription factor [Parabacteroides distasonis]